MRISIVIVTWRGAGLLQRCLRSLARHAAGHPVVVVNNDPGDDATARLQGRFSRVTWISPGCNLGFAGGCNRGLEAAGGDPILFLNPDVEVTAGAVQALAGALLAHPGAALAGGLLVDDRGRPQARYAPRRLPDVAALARRALLPQRDSAATLPAGTGAPRRVEQIAGACLMARRRALAGAGAFDAGFWPVWFEDVDLCLRVRRAGHQVLHVPAAVFRHRGAGSVDLMTPEERAAAWYGNLHRYALKHHGRAAAALVRACSVPGAGLRLAAAVAGLGGTRPARARRAAACLQVAARSFTGWPSASRSTS